MIPVYNEERILRETVEQVVAGMRELPLSFFEVLLCENGSKDASPSIAEELSSGLPEVRVITLERADYGAALRAGFLAATGDAIVNFDADYYDIDFVKVALGIDADVVIAAKNMLGSNDARAVSRRLISRVFGFIVRRLLAVRLAETHGIKLFKRTSIHRVVHEVRCTKDLFDTEVLVRAERLGLAMRELPITTVELRHSRSGIVRRIPRTLWGLLYMRIRLRRDDRLRPTCTCGSSHSRTCRARARSAIHDMGEGVTAPNARLRTTAARNP